MIRVLKFAFLVTAIIAAVAAASPALAAGEGVLTGQIVNKTAGGSQIGALQVSLVTYVNGKATDGSQNTTADAQGRFEFRGLGTDSGTTYAARTTFQSANYTSTPVALTSANASQAVTLAVYDATTSDEKIQISTGHTVVYPVDGALEILDVWSVQNVGDKTFIGMPQSSGNTTVKFTLPAGAMSPTAGDGIDLTFVGRDAFSSSPVPPGSMDFNYSYLVPFAGSEANISRTLDYATADYHLLVQDTGAKVSSSVLTQGPKQNLSGTAFLDLAGRNLGRGVALDAALSGIKVTSNGATSSFPWPWLLVGIGVLAVVLIGYPRLRRQTIGVSTESGSRGASQSPEIYDEETLIAEMARLDDDFEAGSMGEAAYRTQRSRLKGVLADMYAQQARNGRTGSSPGQEG